MDKKIASVIKYFAVFDFFPNLMDVYTFFPEKITKKKLKKILEANKYTPPQYSIVRKISEKKLNNWRFRAYVKLISLFPQIKLVGLSGSISMMNAGEEDDIDLFIITAKNRLFTGRLIALVLAQLLGLRRNRDSEKITFSSSHKDKVCLNLFFDESNLRVPKFKQTLFVGHEVLQMKPIIIKGNIYERFLMENKWVFRIFPNARQVFSMKYLVSSIKNKEKKFSILNTRYYILDTISNKIEKLLKKLQLNLINKHRTTEIITSTQLWFHPNDYNSFM